MNYESSIHISNLSDRVLCFRLEPWGEQIEMMAGVTFVVVAEAETQGSFEVDYGETDITVWAWPTASVKIFANGTEIEAGTRLAVPQVPVGQSVSSFLGTILGRKKRM